jgi:hypothetical protein
MAFIIKNSIGSETSMYAVCSKQWSKKFCLLLYRRKFTTSKSFFSVEQIFLIKLSVDSKFTPKEKRKIYPSFLSSFVWIKASLY